MAANALLHELLLALLGHTGQCIKPVLSPIQRRRQRDTAPDADPAAAEGGAVEFEVTGLALAEEVALLSPAERAAINDMLVAAFSYVRIMHFVQNIDGGATTLTTHHTHDSHRSTQAPPDPLAAAASSHPKLASTPAEQRALESQAARHVYGAAGALLSPPKPSRPPNAGRGVDAASPVPFSLDPATAVVQHHPLVQPAHSVQPPQKAVGLYLRALGVGLEEVLSGYRSLILHVEQEILSAVSCDPESAPQYRSEGIDEHHRDASTTAPPPPPVHHRIEYGLARLSLRLRQYLVILPALQSMIAEIVAAPPTPPLPSQQAEQADRTTDESASAPPSTAVRFRSHSVHGIRLLNLVALRLVRSGVPSLRVIYSNLLRRLDAVFINQLGTWMFQGQVRDQWGEFCIRDNRQGQGEGEEGGEHAQWQQPHTSSMVGAVPSAAIAAPRFDWDSSFLLDSSQLPLVYLDELPLGGMDTMHRILFIGKALLVLRRGEAEQEDMRRRSEAQRRRRQQRRGQERRGRGGRDTAAAAAAASSAAAALLASAGAQTPLGASAFSPTGSLAAASQSHHMRTGSLSSTAGGVTPRSPHSSRHHRRASTGAGSGGVFNPSALAPPPVTPAAGTPPAVPQQSLTEACRPLLAQLYALVGAPHQQQQQQHHDSSSPSPPPPSLHTSLVPFDSLVSHLASLVSQRLYTLLVRGRSPVLPHLRHFKAFLLLQRGEFADKFIERARMGMEKDGVPLPLPMPAQQAASNSSSSSNIRLLERELNGRKGALKQALAYAGLNMDAAEGDAEEEEGEDDDDDERIDPSATFSSSSSSSSKQHNSFVANYPVHHLSVHLDALPVPAPAPLHGVLPAAPASAAGTSDGLWSCIRLAYAVRPPLDLLLTPSVLGRYNAIFRLLLRTKRVALALHNLWHPSMERTRATHSPSDPLCAPHMPSLALRHSMSFLLDTLWAYWSCDVIDAAWSELEARVQGAPSSSSSSSSSAPSAPTAAAADFEGIRGAHEDYLNKITSNCFLKDRVILNALTDLFETCALFCRAYPAPAATLHLLTRDYARHSAFLFALLSRKAAFTGGRSGLLHALVSRLDFNGHFSRLSATIGTAAQEAGKQAGGAAAAAAATAAAMRHMTPAHARQLATATALVPASHAWGTVTSAGDIAASMRGSGGGTAGSTATNASTAAAPLRSAGSYEITRVVPYSAAASASVSASTPAHLSVSSLTSQAHLFAHGSTRPPAAGYTGQR